MTFCIHHVHVAMVLQFSDEIQLRTCNIEIHTCSIRLLTRVYSSSVLSSNVSLQLHFGNKVPIPDITA